MLQETIEQLRGYITSRLVSWFLLRSKVFTYPKNVITSDEDLADQSLRYTIYNLFRAAQTHIKIVISGNQFTLVLSFVKFQSHHYRSIY